MANKMKKLVQSLNELGVFWSWITAIVSVVLIIASFIIPPTGIIDASVFAGVGELMGVKVICFDLTKMVEAGYKIKYKDILEAAKES